MIIYLIGCFEGSNTGRGGHYYSLITMAESIGVSYQVLVVGDFFPPAYEKKDNITFLYFKRNQACRFEPKKYNQSGEVTIVHAYDNKSAVFASKLAAYLNVPLIVTKAGGAPLKKYSIFFSNMVVFHGQDRDLLERRRLFKPKNLALIPNRVVSAEVEPRNRVSPFPKKSKGAIKIIRIARIGSAYLDSILQSYQLFKRLESLYGQGAVYLSVVGYVEDKSVFKSLKTKIAPSLYVNFYNTPEYYKSASDLIKYADIVVGTGRSFMEGMLYNKFVFFPVSGSSIPCFSSPAYYEKAFYKNFSPRVTAADGVDAEASFDEFVELLNDPCEMHRYFEWSREKFKQNHDVKVGAKKMLDFYDHVKYDRSNYYQYLIYYFWSMCLHWFFSIKRIIKSSIPF